MAAVKVVKKTRKNPTPKAQIAVWAAAAGRCTICNSSVLNNELTGSVEPLGELAHNVAAVPGGPRGESELTRDERAEADNLLLICRNCHPDIDSEKEPERWTVEQLTKWKRDHEQRVFSLTAINADRAATLIRLVGNVRGVPAHLSSEAVLRAATNSGIYPNHLPGSYNADIDCDLRHLGEIDSEEDFVACTKPINELVARVHDGIRRDQINKIAVFAFARIPLITYLGAQLDDKIPTVTFQRHRTEEKDAWTWPTPAPGPIAFNITTLQSGSDESKVAVIHSLSGSILKEELPALIDKNFTIYLVAPKNSDAIGPSLFSSLGTLSNYEDILRDLLARIENDHGKIQDIHTFPAMGVAPALTLGRVLMPHISPGLIMYDRTTDRSFVKAMRVKR